jgi:hypothetical protein
VAITPSKTIALPDKGWTIEPTIVAIKIARSVHDSRLIPSGTGMNATAKADAATTSHRHQVFDESDFITESEKVKK